jgi:hypothetical protein
MTNTGWRLKYRRVYRPPEETSIYALIEPDTGEIRYVGKADNLHKRLLVHVSWTRGANDSFPKTMWIRSLLARNQRPEMIELERVPFAKARERECYWIARKVYEGCDLVNHPREISAALAHAAQEDAS